MMLSDVCLMYVCLTSLAICILQHSAWERIGRGKLLLRCVGSAALGASAPTEGEGRWHIVAAARLQLVIFTARRYA